MNVCVNIRTLSVLSYPFFFPVARHLRAPSPPSCRASMPCSRPAMSALPYPALRPVLPCPVAGLLWASYSRPAHLRLVMAAGTKPNSLSLLHMHNDLRLSMANTSSAPPWPPCTSDCTIQPGTGRSPAWSCERQSREQKKVFHKIIVVGPQTSRFLE